jgi:hypothetical protein
MRKYFPAVCFAVVASALASGLLIARAAEVPLADDAAIAAFRADLAAKFKTADKNYDTAIIGKDGWMFFVPEVRSVSVGKFWGEDAKKVSQAIDPNFADPLPAILDFKNQLDKVGIKLLLVPVPPKSIIYADKISNKAPAPKDGVLPRVDSAHQEFYKLLRDNGVNVLDLTDEFLKAREVRFQNPDTKLIEKASIYCRQDTHWSGLACFITANLIKKIVSPDSPAPKTKYSAHSKFVAIKGDLWDSLPAGTKRPAQEKVLLNFIGTPDPKNKSTLLPVPTSKTSPVILLGDSHTLVFHEGGDMHTKGAGLADQLAYVLGLPVDLIGVRGSGATPARANLMRRARADANYLKNKKWVVWCFSAREWTESAGWQKVPVVK